MPKDTAQPFLYSPTQSLNVKYTFNNCILENASIVVDGLHRHAILYAGCSSLLAKRQSLTHGTGRQTYPGKILNRTNIATAAVTLLYTDTSTDEGYLGEDIECGTYTITTDKETRILSPLDFYDDRYEQPGVKECKAARSHSYNYTLTERVENFSKIVGNYELPTANRPIYDVNGLNQQIQGPMFHETYHHSEQVIMNYLSSTMGMKMLASAALKSKASYLYGVILDIYTQRTLCSNCNVNLLGMQNSHQQGFLQRFGEALEKKDIQPRLNDQLMLSTRVSASRPQGKGRKNMDQFRLVGDAGVVHEYDADSSNHIFQADTRALGTERIINEQNYELSSYRGAFFASKSFPTSHLEKAIKLPAAQCNK